MTHANELDLGPLTWVKSEIDQALARSAEALTKAGTAGEDLTHIQFAQTHLHQACGALSIVGLDGLTRFAHALDQFLGAMARGECAIDASTLETGSHGLAAIGNYLEELVRGTPDQPLRLFSLYERIAAAQGRDAPSRAELFFPDLTRRPPRGAATVSGADPEPSLRRLRAHFHRGLLRWLKQPSEPEGPRIMVEAAAGLEKLQGSPATRTLWFVAQALFEALAAEDLPTGDVRQVCTGMERELRHQAAGSQTVPDALMRDMLYWITLAPARTERQRAVREIWALDSLIPEPGATVTEIPLAPLLKSLHAEVGSGKRAWDEFCTGQAAALPKLEAHLLELGQHTGQLGRPALDRLVGGVTQFTQWLRKDPLQFNDAIAIEMATALLLIEVSLDRGVPEAGFVTQVNDTLQRLDALTRGEAVPAPEHSATVEAARRSQEKEARAQVAREMLSNLAQVEQALDDYFRNQSKRAPLAGLARPLKQIEGALALVGDEQAIGIVHEASEAVARFATSEEAPDLSEFESLARNLSALGFYIESLQHGPASLDRLLHPEKGEVDDQLAAEVAAEAPAREIAALQETVILGMTDLTGEEPFAPEAEPESAPEMLEEIAFLEPEAPAVAEPEAVPAPVESAATTPAVAAESAEEEEALDAELLAIFIEEAHEVLATIDEQLELSRNAGGSIDALTAIRRGFHTLKGSGRMVGLHELGEAAWGIEQTLNRWLQLEWPVSAALDGLLTRSYEVFSGWVRQIEEGRGHGHDVSALMAEAAALRESESASESSSAPQPESTTPVDLVETALELDDYAVEEELDIRSEETAAGMQEPAEFLPEETALDELPLEEVHIEETSPEAGESRIESLEAFELSLPELDVDERAASPAESEQDDTRLAETAASELPPPQGETPAEEPAFDFGDLPEDIAGEEPLETTDLTTETHETEAEPLEPLAVAPDEVEPVQERIAEPDFSFDELPEPIDLSSPESELPAEPSAESPVTEAPTPEAVELAPEPTTLRIGDVEISRALFDLYLAEAHDHVRVLREEFAHLQRDPTSQPSEPALRAAHTLAGISGTSRMAAPHDLARALEHAIERLRERDQAPEGYETDLFDATATTLEGMLAELGVHQVPLTVPELAEQLHAVGQESPREALTASIEPPAVREAHGSASAVEVLPEEPEPAATVHDDLDEQLLPIFIEEGTELLGQLDTTLRAWREGPDEGEHAKNTARLLHTLKGSARMAGAMTLGEHLHRIETRLERASPGPVPDEFLEDILAGLDQANQMVSALARGERTPAAPADRREVKAAVEIETAPATAAEASGSSATLRVRADLVDRFVNEAGEIGIARTRIEGELRTLRRSLLDLTENVIRLRNQLREVEIQAEVQMQSRIAQAESKHADFDPLEMDRFTRLQELTRMMAESVGDVTTVQQNLLLNLDGAELALHGQARLSRDLQQALMQVRMVPFDSLADRLHRIVRQSAKDLGKRANLDLRGGRIEIDRSVLERMTGPLEHLLRNAVAHGIESPERRSAQGKDPIGQITLAVSHEGNEIAISLRDDGEGLDFQAIGEKARAKGLLTDDEAVDERRLTNLIFVPGFSTAGAVSEIAGRGVGMDVVKSDTASVGGRIDVRSNPSEGTEFRIHLPLTLAVTQALLVRAAGRTWAIPSSMIAQVMELKPDALERVRATGGTEWQDRHFAYRYLPSLLGDRQTQPEIQRFNWLLLLHAGAQTLALHVDALRGNQEIVVKNAGPQLVRIVGISGATVLGDGEIVLILNPVALASRSLAETTDAAGAPVAPAQVTTPTVQQPTVLIVDDSLTVRKITGRLLEREGYRVMTAKDGADALEKLLETVPDVILSDIEMPRMDGFDLVRNIRADDRLKNVPVVMITSRLADKHRQYAEKIGANHYLGKPYEEDELLALLRGYTGHGT